MHQSQLEQSQRQECLADHIEKRARDSKQRMAEVLLEGLRARDLESDQSLTDVNESIRDTKTKIAALVQNSLQEVGR